jgi:hypothetical protein
MLLSPNPELIEERNVKRLHFCSRRCNFLNIRRCNCLPRYITSLLAAA